MQSGVFTQRWIIMIIFDATSYTNKPDLRELGIYPCIVHTWVKPDETMEDAVRRWTIEAYDTRSLLCFDFEPMADYGKDTSSSIEIKLDQWNSWIDIARSERPTVCMGNYHSPWNSREAYSRDNRGKIHWRGLVDRLNFTAPSTYSRKGESFEQWKTETMRRIKIARDFQRPIYCFVNTTRYEEAPYEPIENLDQMVQFIANEADGVIVWGGWYYDEKGIYRERPFDGNSEWVDKLINA